METNTEFFLDYFFLINQTNQAVENILINFFFLMDGIIVIN